MIAISPVKLHRVGRASFFFPRGGSAQGIRATVPFLRAFGFDTLLVSGSRTSRPDTDAAAFYGSLLVHEVRYTPTPAAATLSIQHSAGLTIAPSCVHQAYERGHADGDESFFTCDRATFDLQVATWARAIASARWETASVLHLHHLTPIHAAARYVCPEVPYITHLHGTELKFLESLLNDDTHAGFNWVTLMRTWAQGSAAVICASQDLARRASDLLGLRAEAVAHVPQGVDPTRFAPRDGSHQLSAADWLDWLVQRPRGWDSSGRVGSIRYQTDQVLADFVPAQDRGLAIFVGRFLGFKGLPLLLRAYQRARAEHGVTAPLVIWGGSPGEWDGEHPFDLAKRLGLQGVYFVGWRPHDDLSRALASATVMVAPSVSEPFGLVYLEAMATGTPVIATRSGGPLDFVNTDTASPNGWLVEPHDVETLTHALVAALTDRQEARLRGYRARQRVTSEYTWHNTAARLAALYASVATGPLA